MTPNTPSSPRTPPSAANSTPFINTTAHKKKDSCEEPPTIGYPEAGAATPPGSSPPGLHPKAVVFLLLWYFWSGCTLFLNKYVVFYMKGDATFLACSQMWLTAALGLAQTRYPLGMFDRPQAQKRPKDFLNGVIIVGSLRYLTVLLGLVALNYVVVSFTETVKSSAPAFTVLIARLLLAERTGLYVNLSLIPVMGGLALCSANELSFNVLGFLAALGANVSECLQNVYSKKLISNDKIQ